MKIRLAIILSVLMMFSGIQDGMSQIRSIMFSTDSCCSSKASTVTDDECASLDISDEESSESCCEGAACDCTCCIHISLFNTNFAEALFSGEAEKDVYNYVDANSHPMPFPIFHPPSSLI